MSRIPKWRMTPSALFRLLIALVLALAFAYSSRAQDIASESEGDVVMENEAPTRSAAVEAVLASINARNPQTPIEWLQAVRVLRQMGAQSDAQPFLDQVLAAELDLQDKVALHRAIGTAELVRLSVDRQLPDAREFVLSVFEAVRTARRNPEKLRLAVDGLSSKNPTQQSLSRRTLQDAGAYAVPAIVAALLNEKAKVNSSEIEAVIARIGKDAEEPLLALLGAPHPELQTFAAKALSRTNSKRAALHLVRPFFTGTQEARSGATDYYQRFSAKPSSVQGSVSLLLKKAKYHLAGNPPVNTVDGKVEMWAWSAEENNVVPYELAARSAGAVVAARFARDAYELSGNPETTRLLLVTRLQVDQLLGGVDRSLPRGPGSAFQLGATLGPESVREALHYSEQHGLDAAIQGACELLAYHHRNLPDQDWSAVVRVVQNPSRRVRHAAVRAIMSIDPRQPFAGASYFQEALIDLLFATGSPRAIVGIPRRGANDSLSGTLSGLGLNVVQTNESTPLLQMAAKSSDLDVVFLSDSCSSPVAGEAIQQLRKHPFTKNLPVVLVARAGNLEQAQRIANRDSRTLVLPEFADEVAVVAVLEKAEQLVASLSVSPARRLQQANEAIDWLTHLAQYSQTYSWYDLQRGEDAVLQAVSEPSLSDRAITLLGYLGGKAAQVQLAQVVGQQDLSIESRQNAANAFTEAVTRRGLMLRSREVYRQYDRYNASQTEEVAAQEALGQVLDVIETQTQ